MVIHSTTHRAPSRKAPDSQREKKRCVKACAHAKRSRTTTWRTCTGDSEQVVNKQWISSWRECSSSVARGRFPRRFTGLTPDCLVASNTRLFADPLYRSASARRHFLSLRAKGEEISAHRCAAITPRDDMEWAKGALRRRQPSCRVPAACGFAGKMNHGYQTHFSALRGQTQAHARFPRADEVARRPCRAERAPRQGTQAPRHLSEGEPTARYAFSRAHRLQSEAEFAAVAQAGPDAI